MTGAALLAAFTAAAPAQATESGREVLNALARARLAEEAGDPRAALTALTDVASRAPGLPGLRGRILEQAMQGGDLAAARSAAMQLWTSGERRFDARLVLTVDAVRRSDWRAARTFAGVDGDKTGGDPMTRLLLPVIGAWIEVGARGKLPERPLLAAGARGRPEPAFILEAALVQLAAKRPADAVALADATMLTDRTSQLVALRLAATLDAAGEGEAAKRLRGRIALATGGREDPLLLLSDRPVSTPRGGIAHWLALLADGFARAPVGNSRLPLMIARSAWWLDASDPTVRSALVEALDRDGQRQAALALLADNRGAPPLPALAMRKAELLADAGDLGAATTLAEAAAAQAPASRSLLVRFADIARRSDDGAAAERAYARLEADLGDSEEDRALHATILIARADLLLQKGEWDKAQPMLDRAVALRPGDPTILNFAGYSALERRRNIDASLAQIEAAWKAEPQNPSITDSLGWAYVLTGRIAEALPLLEAAQRGEPENPVIVEHLGDAYWQAGQRFSARYVWRAAALIADADMATRLEAKLRDGLTPATMAP
ncbi:MAG: tetratricopeptide repeat protein [Sphingopyxis granuli]